MNDINNFIQFAKNNKSAERISDSIITVLSTLVYHQKSKKKDIV